MDTKYFKWNLSITGYNANGGLCEFSDAPNHITSASINTVTDANSTCSISFALDNPTFIIDRVTQGTPMAKLPVITDIITLSLNGNIVFTGKVISSKVASNTYSIECSDDLMMEIKNGNIREIDNVPADIKSIVFKEAVAEIASSEATDRYSKYHDESCKYTGAKYYKSYNTNDLVRTVIFSADDFDMLDINTIDATKIDSSGFSISNNSKIKDGKYNIVDIIFNVNFTRVVTLVKNVVYDSVDANRPSDIRSTIAVDDGNGGTTNVYKAYDLPAKKTYVVNAFEQAGWKLYSSSYTYSTANILDVNGVDVIHQTDVTNDITHGSLYGYRTIKKNATLPICVRLINEANIQATGQVRQKEITNSYTYSYDGTITTNPISSSYIDIIGTAHDQVLTELITKAKYEILEYKAVGFSGVGSCSVIIDGNTLGLFTDDLPYRVSVPTYVTRDNDTYLVSSRSLTLDVGSGSAMGTLNLASIERPTVIEKDALPPNPEGPPDPVWWTYGETASPYTSLGSGYISTTGSYTDDNDWAFDANITLSHKYNSYTDGTLLVEHSTNPELTVTNYYLHDIYKAGSVETWPYADTNEQVRIKRDKEKPIYSKAIVLPVSEIPMITLNVL